MKKSLKARQPNRPNTDKATAIETVRQDLQAKSSQQLRDMLTKYDLVCATITDEAMINTLMTLVS